MTEIFIATQNSGKIAEFKGMLDPHHIRFKTLKDIDLDDIEESGTTFAANALIKAKAGFEQSGMLTIADDSGLEVDLLGGAPGVYSARYGGLGKSDQDRIDFLLDNLKQFGDQKRTAQFKTVICVYANQIERYFEGVWVGEILFEQKGGHGFGYDPVFFDPKRGATAAELTHDQKAEISHRGQAMQQLLIALPEIIKQLK